MCQTSRAKLSVSVQSLLSGAGILQLPCLHDINDPAHSFEISSAGVREPLAGKAPELALWTGVR